MEDNREKLAGESNTILEKKDIKSQIKFLSKRHIIIIAVSLIAVVAIALFLLSKPSTPFDKILDCPSLDKATEVLGDYDDASGNDIEYYHYKGFGYDGYLEIRFSLYSSSAPSGVDKSTWSGFTSMFSSSWFFERAVWRSVYSENNVDGEKMVKKIVSVMDKRFGKNTRNDGDYVWYDTFGHKFVLSANSSQANLYFYK